MVDLQGLEEFSHMPDRDEAPFLTGRDGEMRLIDRLCRNALGKVTAGKEASSMTALLQGAPGAGKTSILNHLIDRWRKDAENAPYVVKIKPADLEDEAELAVAIIEAVRPGASLVWRTEHTAGRTGRAGFSGTGMELADGTIVQPGPRSLNNILSTLRGDRIKGPNWIWDRPIVLMVDEIQSLQPPVASMIQSLHTGLHGLPLVPLFAGLGDSLSVIERFASGSRLTADNVMRLGSLQPEQAASVAHRMFRTYDVRGSDAARRQWTDWAVDVSDAWPQHLHNALRAMARGLLRTRGRLDDVDAGQVHEQERNLRLAVYRRRLSDPMKDARRLVAAVMRDCSPGTDGYGPYQDDMLASIRRHRRFGDRPEDVSWELPKHPPQTPRAGQPMDEDSFLRHLIHRGSLHEREDGGFECPIPTFRDFLVHRGNPVPALEHCIDPSPSRISATEPELVPDKDADPSP